MRRTTLVTLKARSQAFRMAMGVLHEGKVSSVRQARCWWCKTMFDVPIDEPERRPPVCPVCREHYAKKSSEDVGEGLTPRCEYCGEEFSGAPNMALCPRCIGGLKCVVRAMPRVTFKRVVKLALVILFFTVIGLILICIGEGLIITMSPAHHP